MEIITGYTGKKHITSEQDRDVHMGIVGEESHVLPTGMQMAAEVSSNNEIKIRDGVLMHQGCAASIKKNTYDSLTIANGSQGMKRIDLIVARYQKSQDTRVESLELKVIQGTPAESDPAVPEYTHGDIQSGDYEADMPMYQVIVDGLNITEVKKVFEITMTNKDLTDKIADCANDVRFIAFTKTPTSTGSSAQIATINEINSLFGVSNATQQNSGAIVMNGDATTSGAHFDGVTWNGDNLVAVFDRSVGGSVRVTGLLYYAPVGATTL